MLSTTGDVATSTAAEINHFRGNYEFLSNFFRSTIQRDGLDYPTVEHAFQAAKCLDTAGKLKILANKSPSVAKRVGRTVQLRPDWESVKVDIMEEILRQKFTRGSTLGSQLLATGEARLVEGNTWHDQYWGSCSCQKHAGVPGVNILGKLLTKVRDELKEAEFQ